MKEKRVSSLHTEEGQENEYEEERKRGRRETRSPHCAAQIRTPGTTN
jgi:hypothetical protein